MAGCSKKSSTAVAPTMAATTASKGTTTPADYAAGVCSAINGWLTTVQNGATAVGTPKNPTEGKAAILKYLSGVVDSTQTMIDKVDAVGAPAIDNGAEIQATVLSALNKVKDVFSQAETKAESLSTTNQAEFQATTAQIGASLQAASPDIQTSLSSISSSGLDQAFSNDPECQKLAQITSSPPPSP
jgi:hypothetical protein